MYISIQVYKYKSTYIYNNVSGPGPRATIHVSGACNRTFHAGKRTFMATKQASAASLVAATVVVHAPATLRQRFWKLFPLLQAPKDAPATLQTLCAPAVPATATLHVAKRTFFTTKQAPAKSL